MKKIYSFLLLFMAAIMGANAGIIPVFKGGSADSYCFLKVGGLYAYLDGTQIKLGGSTPVLNNDAYLFQFEGSATSFKILTKNGNKYLGYPESGRLIVATDLDQTWQEYIVSTTTNQDHLSGHFFKNTSKDKIANNRTYASVKYMGEWGTNHDNGSKIEVETEGSVIDRRIADVNAKIAEYEGRFGEVLGNFIKPSNWETVKNMPKETVEQKKAFCAAFDALTFNLVMPKAGDFLRMRSYAGTKYASIIPVPTGNADMKDRLSLTTSAEASTLFYFDGTTLTGVLTGRGIGVKPKMNPNNGYLAYVLPYGQDPANAKFRTSSRDRKFYNVLFGDDASGQPSQGLWISKNANVLYLDGSTGWRDGNDENLFKLEAVNSIQVELGAAGVATFVIPANVKMTVSGATAYKVTEASTTAGATLVALSGVIGATTDVAIVLKGTSGAQATLQIVTGEPTADLNGNMLKGSVVSSASQNKTVDRDYGLMVSGSNALFAKADADLPYRPFRAVLSGVTEATGGSVSGFSLNFIDDVTAIERAQTKTADAPVYDLGGRRVKNVVKGGLYLKNGKKFVQP